MQHNAYAYYTRDVASFSEWGGRRGGGSDKKLTKKRININQNEEFKYLTGNFWCSSYALIMSLNANIFHIYHSIIDNMSKNTQGTCIKNP